MPPHLVKLLPFLFPVYSDDSRALWQVHLGLFIYDCLAGRGGGWHHKLDLEEILQKAPGLKSQGLVGGCSYYDAHMQDNRLVIENILAAEQAGAHIHNYTEVVGLLEGEYGIRGVKVRAAASGEEREIVGQVVVNATGAWSAKIGAMEPNADHCLPAPTKGVHIVVSQILADTALLLHAPQDGRVFFVLPWEGMSLVGTTDTFFDGNPDHPTVEAADQHYLLESLNRFFPERHFTEADIIASFAGLRPLVAPNTKNAPSDIAREHVIHVSTGGLISVLGGKYTTHRQIAEDVVDSVIAHLKTGKRYLPCATEHLPLPGASGEYPLQEVESKLRAAGLSDATISHLLNTYGTLSMEILKIVLENPQEAEVICSLHPHIFAELTYAIRKEHVKTAEDWLFRRTHIGYTSCGGQSCSERVTERIKAKRREGMPVKVSFG